MKIQSKLSFTNMLAVEAALLLF